MSLDMRGGRVHFPRYERRQGACHWILQEAGCMSLYMTGGRVHVAG
jgi:hypothetical protein